MKQALLVLLLSFSVGVASLTTGQTSLAEPKHPAQSVSIPTLDQILDKYTQALGGRPAYEKLTTRVAAGEWENVSRGVSLPVHIYAKAPDKQAEYLEAPENRGTTGRGYDGTTGWSMNLLETGFRKVSGAELAGMQREAGFYKQINLKQYYKEMTIKGRDIVKGRDVYVIEATPEQGSDEKLYFDALTGLLVRQDVVYESPYGKMPVQRYYEDYREVDAVKLPFVIRSEGQVVVVTRLKEVKHNTPIDDSRFKSPVS